MQPPGIHSRSLWVSKNGCKCVEAAACLKYVPVQWVRGSCLLESEVFVTPLLQTQWPFVPGMHGPEPGGCHTVSDLLLMSISQTCRRWLASPTRLHTESQDGKNGEAVSTGQTTAQLKCVIRGERNVHFCFLTDTFPALRENADLCDKLYLCQSQKTRLSYLLPAGT